MHDVITKKTESIFGDSTSNFWDDLKERINAPFFVSFIISWCFINWKVIVLLFWYSNAEIFSDKKVYRIDAISNELCWVYSFFLPLLTTAIYIFAYPYIKEYLRTYNARIKTKGNQWINKVSRDESFQIRNYFKVKNLYYAKIKELEEQRLEEAVFENDRDKLEKKIDYQTQEIKKYEDLIKFYVDKANLTVLHDQEWKLSSLKYYNTSSPFCLMYVYDESVSVHATGGVNSIFRNVSQYSITNYVHNVISKTININLTNTNNLDVDNPTFFSLTISYQENGFKGEIMALRNGDVLYKIDVMAANYY